MFPSAQRCAVFSLTWPNVDSDASALLRTALLAEGCVLALIESAYQGVLDIAPLEPRIAS